MIRYRFNRGRCFEVRWEVLILWEKYICANDKNLKFKNLILKMVSLFNRNHRYKKICAKKESNESSSFLLVKNLKIFLRPLA